MTGDTIPIDGTFTIQFANETFQDVLAAIDSGQTVTPSFAVSFLTSSSTVPEPDTWTAIVIGAAGMGLRYRRSLKKR